VTIPWESIVTIWGHRYWRATRQFIVRFQVSAALWMRSWSFWYITQRRLVVSYRRFGISYLSNLQEKSLTLEDWTDWLSWNSSNYQSTLRNIPEERDLTPIH
jgi:hypothetical protein